MRDRGVRQRVDHLAAVLDDPAALVVAADHVPRDVLEEHQRGAGLVAQLDELGRLLGRVGEQHPVVGQDSHGKTVHLCPSSDQRGSVSHLELFEAAAVDHARNDLPGVDRGAQVQRHQPEQFPGVVARRLRGRGDRARALLAPVQVGHHVAGHPDRVVLVVGQVVGQAAVGGVHLRAAEFLVAGVLPGGDLHQRRAAEEHLGAAADEDVVVGQSRLVGPARGGTAEHHRDRGDAPRGQFGDVVEHPAALGEVGEVAPHRRVRVLAGAAAAQVAAGRLDELDVGHPVVPGDLQGAHQLADADHGHGPAEVGRVVADDHALGALDHPDAEHHAAADVVVGLVAGQRADLQERAVRIQQQRDALPDEQLAAALVPGDRPLPAAERRLPEQAVDLAEQAEHPAGVGQERLAAGVDGGGQDRRGHGLSR